MKLQFKYLAITQSSLYVDFKISFKGWLGMILYMLKVRAENKTKTTGHAVT